jgi:hypothetical protein
MEAFVQLSEDLPAITGIISELIIFIMKCILPVQTLIDIFETKQEPTF